MHFDGFWNDLELQRTRRTLSLNHAFKRYLDLRTKECGRSVWSAQWRVRSIQLVYRNDCLSLRLDSRRGLTSFIGQNYQSSFEVLNYLNNLDLESSCKTVQNISGVLLDFFIFNDVIKKRSSELVSIHLQHHHVYLHFTS